MKFICAVLLSFVVCIAADDAAVADGSEPYMEGQNCTEDFKQAMTAGKKKCFPDLKALGQGLMEKFQPLLGGLLQGGNGKGLDIGSMLSSLGGGKGSSGGFDIGSLFKKGGNGESAGFDIGSLLNAGGKGQSGGFDINSLFKKGGNGESAGFDIGSLLNAGGKGKSGGFDFSKLFKKGGNGQSGGFDAFQNNGEAGGDNAELNLYDDSPIIARFRRGDDDGTEDSSKQKKFGVDQLIEGVIKMLKCLIDEIRDKPNYQSIADFCDKNCHPNAAPYTKEKCVVRNAAQCCGMPDISCMMGKGMGGRKGGKKRGKKGGMKGFNFMQGMGGGASSETNDS